MIHKWWWHVNEALKEESYLYVIKEEERSKRTGERILQIEEATFRSDSVQFS
jgi:hypothetical protein